MKVRLGFRTVEVPPSPNVQAHDVGDPDDVSVNATSNGAVPDDGDAVNDATGGTPTVTVTVELDVP